jgi:hypothetical protein
MAGFSPEAYFGNPESVARFGAALQQTAVGLEQLQADLERDVSTLVPGAWDGGAALSCSDHLRQRSAAAAQMAQAATGASTAMTTLSAELAVALGQFEQARGVAAACRVQIVSVAPEPVVVPLDPEAAANVDPVRALVEAAKEYADQARARAKAKGQEEISTLDAIVLLSISLALGVLVWRQMIRPRPKGFPQLPKPDEQPPPEQNQQPPATQGQTPAASGRVYRGGKFDDLATGNGLERHHMIADKPSPIPRNEGPSIQMEVADHRMTGGWGSSADAQAYRAAQDKLLANGDTSGALQMSIKDVRRLFGTKYDGAIAEMLKETGHVEINGIIK